MSAQLYGEVPKGFGLGPEKVRRQTATRTLLGIVCLNAVVFACLASLALSPAGTFTQALEAMLALGMLIGIGGGYFLRLAQEQGKRVVRTEERPNIAVTIDGAAFTRAVRDLEERVKAFPFRSPALPMLRYAKYPAMVGDVATARFAYKVRIEYLDGAVWQVLPEPEGAESPVESEEMKASLAGLETVRGIAFDDALQLALVRVASTLDTTGEVPLERMAEAIGFAISDIQARKRFARGIQRWLGRDILDDHSRTFAVLKIRLSDGTRYHFGFSDEAPRTRFELAAETLHAAYLELKKLQRELLAPCREGGAA